MKTKVILSTLIIVCMLTICGLFGFTQLAPHAEDIITTHSIGTDLYK